MPLQLRKDSLFAIVMQVKKYLARGDTLENFLTDFEFSKRQWDKFVTKNKKLQYAIEDGLVYYKSYWQRELAENMYDKNGSATLAKLAFENALGWTEAARKRNQGERRRKRFKLVLDLGVEKEETIAEELEKLLNKTKEIKNVNN